MIYQTQQKLVDLLTDEDKKLAGNEENSLHQAAKFFRPSVSSIADIEFYLSEVEGVKAIRVSEDGRGFVSAYILPYPECKLGIKERVKSCFQ